MRTRIVMFLVAGLVCLARGESEKDIRVTAASGIAGGYGQTYAVFIGVNQYDDPGVKDLECAAQDAREMWKVLVHETGTVPIGNAKLLVDGALTEFGAEEDDG